MNPFFCVSVLEEIFSKSQSEENECRCVEAGYTGQNVTVDCRMGARALVNTTGCAFKLNNVDIIAVCVCVTILSRK